MTSRPYSVLLLLAGAVLCPLPAPAQAPADFSLTALAGGVSHHVGIRIVVIDSTGAGEVCRIDPPDRTGGTCSSTEPAAVTAADRDAIWAAVQGGFLALAPSLADSSLADGTFAELIVVANGGTHAVRTQNLSVPAFDAVMAALNAALPPAQRLVYNALP